MIPTPTPTKEIPMADAANHVEVVGTTFPGGAPDAEVHALMQELSDLQTWAVMLATRGLPKSREAMDVVQRTRVLIVERLYPGAKRKDQPDAR
jgi:hypothetical protein